MLGEISLKSSEEQVQKAIKSSNERRKIET